MTPPSPDQPTNSVERRHFVFFGVPLYGHLKPTLGLVEELVRRGHRVTYVMAERFADEVAETGATVLCHPSTFHEYSVPMNAHDTIMAFTRESFAPLPGVLAHLDEFPPDVIAYDILVSDSALVAARKFGVPTVRLHAGFGSNDSVPIGHVGTAEAPEQDSELDPAHPDFVALGEEVDRLIAEADAEAFLRSPEDAPDPGDLNLVFVPEAFQISRETFDDSFVFAGPCMRELDLADTWTPPADGRPVVLISLGTTTNNVPEFFRDCARAFADLPWHVVMTLGRDLDPAALGNLPDNVEVHQWIRQHSVLRHAALVINQGGTGGVMEALYWGLPVVAVTRGDDTRVCAHQIVRLGLGRRIPGEDVTPEILRDLALEVYRDDEARANARAMREHVRESGGASSTADRLEELLDTATQGGHAVR